MMTPEEYKTEFAKRAAQFELQEERRRKLDLKDLGLVALGVFLGALITQWLL